MYIDKVSYQKTFNLGNYSSERIGVDILLNEGEDAKQALETAKQLVTEYHKENNPQIYEEQSQDEFVLTPDGCHVKFETLGDKLEVVRKPKLSIEDSIISTMHTYTDAGLLKKTFGNMASKNPKIQQHLDAKLSELENK